MSLKAFHLVFCAMVLALFIAFGLWCFEEYSATDRAVFLASGILSIVLSGLMPIYLRWILLKLRKIGFISALASFFWLQDTAYACPVCIGNPNHPMVISANKGIVFLLIVTTSVLVLFGCFFVYLTIRSYRFQKEEKFNPNSTKPLLR